MNHHRVTVVMSSLSLALIYALMRAGGASALDLALVLACAGLMAAACALAAFSPTKRKAPCKPPHA